MAGCEATTILIGSWFGSSQPWSSSAGTIGIIRRARSIPPYGIGLPSPRTFPIVSADEGQGWDAPPQGSIRTAVIILIAIVILGIIGALIIHIGNTV